MSKEPSTNSILRQLEEGHSKLAEMRHALSAEATARRLAEQQAVVKDHLLAQLAHELRTPLTPAMLSAASLEKDPRLPAELKPAVEMIRRNTAMCAHLLDELMEAVSLTHGKGIIVKCAIDLHEVIERALEVCAQEAEAKKITLVRDLRAKRTLVHGNAVKLQQALWNLLKNAVKFTPAEGRVEARSFNRDGKIVVEIADTGIGIDAAMLPRLVEPFQQGGTHISQHYGGLGLGLTICHLVAQAHGGKLIARSPGPNQGSVLSIELDLMTEEASQGCSPGLPTGDRGRETAATEIVRSILLVEDHEDTRRALGRLLGDAGFHVDCAQSVCTAFAAARARRYDVLLCDLTLPDGTGHDLLDQLGEHRPHRVIALTGSDPQMLHPTRAKFDVHLIKPIDLKVLTEALS